MLYLVNGYSESDIGAHGVILAVIDSPQMLRLKKNQGLFLARVTLCGSEVGKSTWWCGSWKLTLLFSGLQYYYSIKDISVGGRCVCNGHAEACSADNPEKQ